MTSMSQDISLTIGASGLSFGVNKPTYIIHRPVVKQRNMESTLTKITQILDFPLPSYFTKGYIVS